MPSGNAARATMPERCLPSAAHTTPTRSSRDRPTGRRRARSTHSGASDRLPQDLRFCAEEGDEVRRQDGTVLRLGPEGTNLALVAGNGRLLSPEHRGGEIELQTPEP